MTTAAASPTYGTPRRSATVPNRLQPSLHDRADATEEPLETLYEHPKVSVYSFALGGRNGTLYTGGKGSQTAGTLPWKSSAMEIIYGLDKPIRLRRPKTGAPFLHGGTKTKELNLLMMPNTEMWCVDGVSKFATIKGQSTYRIEFPIDSDSDLKSIEGFKEALRKIIQYEPTDSPCPFRRESNTTSGQEDGLDSPRHRRRVLIGDFEDLSGSPNTGSRQIRDSDSARRSSNTRYGPSLDTSIDDDSAIPPTRSSTVANDVPNMTESWTEDSESPMAAFDSVSARPVTAQTKILSPPIEARPSSPSSLINDENHIPQTKQVPSLESDDIESRTSPLTSSSPAEPLLLGSVNGNAPNSIFVSKRGSGDDEIEEPSQSTTNISSISKAIQSTTKETMEKHEITDPPSSNTLETTNVAPDFTSSMSTAVHAGLIDSATPPAEPLDDFSASSTTSPCSDQTLQPANPDTSAATTNTAQVPEPSPLHPLASPESSYLRHRSTPDASTVISQKSSTPIRSRSPTDPVRRSSVSEANTYILSKLIDLLTSPPSKFIGALADLLHLLYGRAFGGVGAGVVGTLRLPRTPGRWVDSEEDSEAEREEGVNVEIPSEDEWDIDEGIDDYGVPLGNDATSQAGRRVWAKGSNGEAEHE